MSSIVAWLAAATSTDPSVTAAAVARLVNVDRFELDKALDPETEVRFGADPEELPPVASLRKAPIPVVAGLIAATSDPERIRVLAQRPGVDVVKAAFVNPHTSAEVVERLIRRNKTTGLTRCWAQRPDVARFVDAAFASPAAKNDVRSVARPLAGALVERGALDTAADVLQLGDTAAFAAEASNGATQLASLTNFVELVERFSVANRHVALKAALNRSLVRFVTGKGSELSGRFADLLLSAAGADTSSPCDGWSEAARRRLIDSGDRLCVLAVASSPELTRLEVEDILTGTHAGVVPGVIDLALVPADLGDLLLTVGREYRVDSDGERQVATVSAVSRTNRFEAVVDSPLWDAASPEARLNSLRDRPHWLRAPLKWLHPSDVAVMLNPDAPVLPCSHRKTTLEVVEAELVKRLNELRPDALAAAIDRLSTPFTVMVNSNLVFEHLVSVLAPLGVPAVEFGLEMAAGWDGSFRSLVETVELMFPPTPDADSDTATDVVAVEQLTLL